MSTYKQQATEKLNSLIGQIKYAKDALSCEMEKWERKEYEAVLFDSEEELNSHKSHMGMCMELGLYA